MGGKASARAGIWTKVQPFIFRHLKEAAGADADLTTSKTKTDQPTSYFDDTDPDTLKAGIIRRIHYRLNPANAVTFTLRIWSASKAGDYESNMNLLWESPSGQLDDTDYDISELAIPMRLEDVGKIYYSLEWSAATGNIQGFIEVSGEPLEAA